MKFWAYLACISALSDTVCSFGTYRVVLWRFLCRRLPCPFRIHGHLPVSYLFGFFLFLCPLVTVWQSYLDNPELMSGASFLGFALISGSKLVGLLAVLRFFAHWWFLHYVET